MDWPYSAAQYQQGATAPSASGAGGVPGWLPSEPQAPPAALPLYAMPRYFPDLYVASPATVFQQRQQALMATHPSYLGGRYIGDLAAPQQQTTPAAEQMALASGLTRRQAYWQAMSLPPGLARAQALWLAKTLPVHQEEESAVQAIRAAQHEYANALAAQSAQALQAGAAAKLQMAKESAQAGWLDSERQLATEYGLSPELSRALLAVSRRKRYTDVAELEAIKNAARNLVTAEQQLDLLRQELARRQAAETKPGDAVGEIPRIAAMITELEKRREQLERYLAPFSALFEYGPLPQVPRITGPVRLNLGAVLARYPWMQSILGPPEQTSSNFPWPLAPERR